MLQIAIVLRDLTAQGTGNQVLAETYWVAKRLLWGCGWKDTGKKLFLGKYPRAIVFCNECE